MESSPIDPKKASKSRLLNADLEMTQITSDQQKVLNTMQDTSSKAMEKLGKNIASRQTDDANQINMKQSNNAQQIIKDSSRVMSVDLNNS